MKTIKKEHLTLTVDPKLIFILSKISIEEDRSLSNFVNKILWDYVKTRGKKR